MNKQRIQEYLDLIDEQIQLEEQELWKEDTEEYRQSEIRKFLFREIKEIIERKRKQEAKPKPDDELVDGIVGIMAEGIGLPYDEEPIIGLRKEIHKLLEGRKK